MLHLYVLLYSVLPEEAKQLKDVVQPFSFWLGSAALSDVDWLL